MRPNKYKDTQRYIFYYLYLVRPLFRRGNFHFHMKERCVEITYYQYENIGSDTHVTGYIPYRSTTKWETKNTIDMIQDFVIDVYYQYERDGQRQVKLKTLALLLGIGVSATDEKIKKILKNAKKHLHFVHNDDSN